MDAEKVILEYSDSVKTKFKVILGTLTLFIFLLPWLQLFGPGWLQLLIILDLIIFLFYRYRVRRTVMVSEEGISEFLGKQSWVWSWDDLHEVRETRSGQVGTSPGCRVVVEHQSTHDIAFDDQMAGFDKACELIQQHWVQERSKKIDKTVLPMIFLKYW